MADLLNIGINKLQHIGIPVTDLKTSKSFYERFGFQEVMRSEFISEGGAGTCILIQLKDIILELYQFPDNHLDEVRARKNGHVDHIAFDVDDVEATFQLLKTENYTIIEDKPVFLPFWENGCKYFNILGPDREILEFNEIVKS